MSLSPQVRKILNILAELAHNDTERGTVESTIIAHSALPEYEVQDSLNDLRTMGLVREVLPRSSSAKFKLWRLTENGVNTIRDQYFKQY